MTNVPPHQFELYPDAYTPSQGPNAGQTKTWIEVVPTVDRLILTVYSEWGDDYEEVVLLPQEALRLAAHLQSVSATLKAKAK